MRLSRCTTARVQRRSLAHQQADQLQVGRQPLKDLRMHRRTQSQLLLLEPVPEAGPPLLCFVLTPVLGSLCQPS